MPLSSRVGNATEKFESLAKEAVRRNAYTIVRKPLDIDHVLETLKRLAGRRASGDMHKPLCV